MENTNTINSWEKNYERSWENITEDQRGLHLAIPRNQSQSLKRKQVDISYFSNKHQKATIKRGLNRYLFLLIDCSKSVLSPDPDATSFSATKYQSEISITGAKILVTLQYVENFIKEFIEQNPLSQIGIIATSNSIATKVSELSANIQKHISSLRNFLIQNNNNNNIRNQRNTNKYNKINYNEIQINTENVGGECSLQNSLDLAKTSLGFVPRNSTREILILFASMTTCDPGDIYDSIDALKRDNIKCSIVSTSPEIYVCKSIAERTFGKYSVALDLFHYNKLILEFITPPIISRNISNESVNQEDLNKNTLMIMAFPLKIYLNSNDLSRSVQSTQSTICSCHQKIRSDGFVYRCPNCKNDVCHIPCDCPICGISLLSPPHLARSIHHLFPLSPFVSPNSSILTNKQSHHHHHRCYSCNTFLFHSSSEFNSMVADDSISTLFSQCSNCGGLFCSSCDDYLHDFIHNCPKCEDSA